MMKKLLFAIPKEVKDKAKVKDRNLINSHFIFLFHSEGLKHASLPYLCNV